MKVIEGVSTLKKPLENTVLTIGNFDGVHLGHKEILTTVISETKKIKGTSVVMTFNPHPSEVLSPGKPLPKINTTQEKVALIQNQKIDVLILEPFTLDLAKNTPEFFFHEILVKNIDPKVIIIGHDFSFGKDRSGNIDTLKELAQKNEIKVIMIPPFKKDGEVISSSLIRNYLKDGDTVKACDFLGRPFFLRGSVVHGSGRGTKINTPTANIENEDQIVPGDGVYIIMTQLEEEMHPSVGSIGKNITFSETEPPTIEVFLLDYKGDLYGKTIILHYLKKIREMIKFDSAEELQEEIKKDIQKTREFFKLK